MRKEKLLRRSRRKFQKVGFKDPEVDEEDGTINWPNDEENPEIMDDGEEFDPEKHEVKMMNFIVEDVLKAGKQCAGTACSDDEQVTS